MVDFASSTSLCLGNQYCLQWFELLMSSSSARETVSTTFGLVSVLIWLFADIPQLITNFTQKSTDGLSAAFLMMWIIGDLFNLFGCLLEPATIPTQVFTAVLYITLTASLCSQTIYYGYIYPRLKYYRQIKINTPTNDEQSKSEMEKATDVDQCNEFDHFKTDIGLSSPIPVPVVTHKNSDRRPLYYQSARYLSKSHTPIGSILCRRLESSFYTVNPIEEHLLSSTIITQSAPVLKIKTTLCLVSTITFLGIFNLLQSPDTTIHPMGSKPRQEFVLHVGRKLFQDSGYQLSEHGSAGHHSIGNLLGWAMAVLYMSARLPQICLNIRRGNCEGINPMMFLFAVTGNVTYIASILVRSLEWSRICPNLPWLIEPGGCVLLDLFILMQYVYFQYRNFKGQETKHKHQYVA
ncbi:uncharacterized protein LOC109791904 [Cajanus cajan]|uniref:uncharacterized protein LOC109791904 n=1 Tax=Cajanus cajan TaxID=3821 RepID=UPI00098DBB38|nr:uncharacterized protein LOC109791904 [Cajanus cajan]